MNNTQNNNTMKKEVIDRLKWYHGGDGATYEYWRDTKTGDLYEVPLELKRDWNDALNLTHTDPRLLNHENRSILTQAVADTTKA
jgi:hypothetical protein